MVDGPVRKTKEENKESQKRLNKNKLISFKKI